MSRPLDVIFGPGVSGLLIQFQPDPPRIAYDSFDEYFIGSSLDGLTYSTQWNQSPTGSRTVYWMGPYVDKPGASNFILHFDVFDEYTTGTNLNGLASGSNWTSSYVSR